MKLIELIGKEIRDEQDREFEFKNKLIDNAMAIESRRIDAIREIGVEYAKSYWQKKMSQVGENGIE